MSTAPDPTSVEAVLTQLSAMGWRRLLFSIAEVEQALGVSRATVYRLIKAGRLTLLKINDKSVIPAVSVAQLIVSLPARERAAPGAACPHRAATAGVSPATPADSAKSKDCGAPAARSVRSRSGRKR